MNISATDLIAVEYLPTHNAAVTADRVEAAITSGLRVVRLGRLRFALGSDVLSVFPELNKRSS
jgi:hypothetical protein